MPAHGLWALPARAATMRRMAHETDSRTEQRLEDLEIKAAFMEDLVDRLNEVIVRQQDQIDRLIREIGRLREAADSAPTTVRSLREELPPHY